VKTGKGRSLKTRRRSVLGRGSHPYAKERFGEDLRSVDQARGEKEGRYFPKAVIREKKPPPSTSFAFLIGIRSYSKIILLGRGTFE